MKNLNMSIEAFTNELEREMKRLRPGRNVRRLTTSKPERDYTTLAYEVDRSSSEPSISPCIYVEMFYADYLKGTPMDDIKNALEDIVYSKPPEFGFNPVSYDSVKKHLLIRVMSIEQGTRYMNTHPHKVVEDLVIFYSIHMPSTIDEGFYLCMITNSLLEHFGITADQLHEDASENSVENFPVTFTPMDHLAMEATVDEMPECLFEEDNLDWVTEYLEETCTGSNMYILSNELKSNGAAVLFYPGLLQFLTEELEAEELLILPTSVDEIIVIPDAIDEAEIYRQSVIQTNLEYLEPARRLSNNVYGYHAGDDIFYKIS